MPTHQEEFYPMPMFVTLEVGDLSLSAEWYQQALVFRVVYSGPPGAFTLVHLRRERYQDILLIPAQGDSPSQRGTGVTIQFQAGGVGVEEIARGAQAAGAVDVEGPVERPWNVRDVTLCDPDGYRLRFSEPIDMTRSFEDVMGQQEE
jgi:catechol 2,3-dioxygenase-like lactoylglutathione lyase family enzyme